MKQQLSSRRWSRCDAFYPLICLPTIELLLHCRPSWRLKTTLGRTTWQSSASISFLSQSHFDCGWNLNATVIWSWSHIWVYVCVCAGQKSIHTSVIIVVNAGEPAQEALPWHSQKNRDTCRKSTLSTVRPRRSWSSTFAAIERCSLSSWNIILSFTVKVVKMSIIRMREVIIEFPGICCAGRHHFCRVRWRVLSRQTRKLWLGELDHMAG